MRGSAKQSPIPEVTGDWAYNRCNLIADWKVCMHDHIIASHRPATRRRQVRA
jgi:hypothetical protein